MTDKVQKIREEVERLKSQLLRGACSSQIAMETICKEEAYNEVLAILDTMQEEHNEIVDKYLYGKESELVDADDLPKEEPVSEDLKEAADNALESISDQYDIISVGSCFEMFRLGAKWQKAKDQSIIKLAEDHAMLAGMEKMKEQMMTKSIEAVVSQVPCSNEIILYNPSSVDKYYLPQEMNKLGLNKGDKVKLIIIKED